MVEENRNLLTIKASLVPPQDNPVLISISVLDVAQAAQGFFAKLEKNLQESADPKASPTGFALNKTVLGCANMLSKWLAQYIAHHSSNPSMPFGGTLYFYAELPNYGQGQAVTKSTNRIGDSSPRPNLPRKQGNS